MAMKYIWMNTYTYSITYPAWYTNSEAVFELSLTHIYTYLDMLLIFHSKYFHISCVNFCGTRTLQCMRFGEFEAEAVLGA